MDDVKKTWCAPAWLLDPERLERQLDRLSAEGWQLEGTGWLSFRYRRGAPNEYRYRVQYLYESRNGQKDDYVRGSRELRFFMRFLQDKHERMSGRERATCKIYRKKNLNGSTCDIFLCSNGRKE